MLILVHINRAMSTEQGKEEILLFLLSFFWELMIYPLIFRLIHLRHYHERLQLHVIGHNLVMLSVCIR